MSREEAIQYLTDTGISPEHVMELVEALSSSENPSKWIPVSERLPNKLKDVLITFADAPDEYEIAYLKATDNASYKENGAVNEWMTFAGTSYADYEVEAWMPIPPYQSEIPTGSEGSDKECTKNI